MKPHGLNMRFFFLSDEKYFYEFYLDKVNAKNALNRENKDWGEKFLFSKYISSLFISRRFDETTFPTGFSSHSEKAMKV